MKTTIYFFTVSVAMLLISCAEGQFDSVSSSSKKSSSKSSSETDDDSNNGNKDDRDDSTNGLGEGDDSGGGLEFGKNQDYSNGSDGLEINSDEKVNIFCKDHATKKVELKVVFPPDSEVCKWGQDGNSAKGSPGSGIRAVEITTKSIEIGESVASLCSISIDANDNHTIYDDDITFLFEGFAIAGDYLNRSFFEKAGLEETNGLLKYDRKKVIGKNFPVETEWAEKGIVSNFSTRQNSRTQREGSFDLSITEDFIELLPLEVKKKSEISFGFAISGNAHSSDCQHQGFTFDIDVEYVPRKNN